MRILLPILILLFSSCDIKPKKAEMVNDSRKVNYSELKKDNKKFVFVVIDYEDPKLYHSPRNTDLGVVFEELAYTEWVKHSSVSGIKEFSDFTEDDGYRLMDNAKSDIMSQFGMRYSLEVGKVRDFEKRKKLKKDYRRIINTKYLTFDSYKEASLARDKIIKGVQ